MKRLLALGVIVAVGTAAVIGVNTIRTGSGTLPARAITDAQKSAVIQVQAAPGASDQTAAAPQPTPTTDTQASAPTTQTSSSQTAPTPPAFEADSTQYPGTYVDLPAFTAAQSGWSASYSYACDQGSVIFFLMTTPGDGVSFGPTAPIPASYSGTTGPFAGKWGWFRVRIIPAAATCTWKITVN